MLELRLDRVSKHYKQKIAVDSLEFTFRKGVYGLLGANGAGKTTLLRMMAGVLKPTAGEILCGQWEIGKMGGEYRAKLGYLPQEFGYYPNFTPQRYMRYLAELKAVPPDIAEERVEKLLEYTGLKSVAEHKIKSLSGGMIRRLGIAQSLLNHPEILILDEPTSGLDPRERIRFRNMMSALGRERLVLLSSHIVADIEFIADEILVMKGGRLIQTGNPDEIRKNAEGKVWECLAFPEEAEKLQQRFAVSNLKNMEDGKVSLRIVSDSPPAKGAAAVSPNLEDAYLYLTGSGALNRGV
ncbi:MAG: ATP-binding cassette domain-containing protein [Lachnospiraceae bacterium]|nr:ATP-binding cassette domain-containing protein [Lachnospiraceae bacterium]